uniref:Uncharacterized protein n=1 Tax=Cucumis melo TaxID=3656 RepID=A0A9I9EDK4_CUCME
MKECANIQRKTKLTKERGPLQEGTPTVQNQGQMVITKHLGNRSPLRNMKSKPKFLYNPYQGP